MIRFNLASGLHDPHALRQLDSRERWLTASVWGLLGVSWFAAAGGVLTISRELPTSLFLDAVFPMLAAGMMFEGARTAINAWGYVLLVPVEAALEKSKDRVRASSEIRSLAKSQGFFTACQLALALGLEEEAVEPPKASVFADLGPDIAAHEFTR